MRRRFVAWLVIGLVTAVGVVPAAGQRRDPPSRPTPTPPDGPRRETQAGPRRAADTREPVRTGARRDLKGEQQRLQQTQQQLKAERERAEQARRRESSVLAELDQVSRRLADKQREVARLDTRIRSTQTEIVTMRREISKLEGRRALQEALLARRLRAIYKVQAQGGAVPVLLSGDDPIARAEAVRHLTSLAALDGQLIREYRESSEQLADRKGRGEERERELTDLRGAARREQADVDREAGRRRVLLATVRDERTYHERMVGELTDASRRLEAFIRDLQAKQRQAAQAAAEAAARAAKAAPPRSVGPAPAVAAPAPAAFRGRLPWPATGRIAAAFGAQVHPRFGTRTFRSGVDIEAPEGSAVEAVLPGQVAYSGWFKGYGNLIIIDHGDEVFTLYAHVSDLHVKEGDVVRQGQRIGAVGDTGSLSGPRLYFEVRYRGKPQDPEQWLRQRG